MSLDMINHKLTTSTVDKNGVTWWENPTVSVKVSSTGEVYSKKSKKINKAAKSGNYSVYINGVLQPNRFTSLYSRMVLGVKLGVSTIALKNPNKGYSPDNVVVVKRGNNRKKLDSVVGTKTKSIGVDLSVNSVNSQDEVYYTCHEAKEEYITEDGGVFAISEMVQWIWRSCIRNQEEIYLAIASKRMRFLFLNWLHDLPLNNDDYTHFADYLSKCK